MTQFRHEPVMLHRITQLLEPALTAGGVAVDATLGLGGHTEALLTAAPELTVVGIDRDPQALELAARRLSRFGSRFVAWHAVFDDIEPALAAADTDSAVAVLFDLGVSSLQLDSDERGFAYSRETSLDMRMDSGSQVTAEDVVNEYSTEELARVFSQYGEERFAHRIARRIEQTRSRSRITTTTQLADIVAAAVPAAARRRGHPAKRVFQALRIEVNDELGALERGLTAAVHSVSPGGRIAVLSYHSLEDRLVKRTFAAGANPPTPPGLPVIPDQDRPFLTMVTRGAEQPTPQEVAENPRAASARLRVVQVVRSAPSGWRAAA